MRPELCSFHAVSRTAQNAAGIGPTARLTETLVSLLARRFAKSGKPTDQSGRSDDPMLVIR
jgi:hypothetical protein